MRNGGPADSSDAGERNPWTVKAYKKKGSKSGVDGAAVSVTKGHPFNRAQNNYKKGARGPVPSIFVLP